MPFALVRTRSLPELRLSVQEFAHPCGMRHVHVVADDVESAFAVAFPTRNSSDDGRAHILDHLVLCGSRRFPVRDPFMAMTHRSLASFMNALTYEDRTIYPFASADETDFFNLMDVYLDATFFPLLREEDFRQEGWRLTVDQNGELSFEGVVFNEMKGAMASRDHHAMRAVAQAILPGTPYAGESGGRPTAIPALTYADLLTFHREFYHPSRAVLLSYGRLAPESVQARAVEALGERLAEPSLPPVPPARSTRHTPFEVTAAVPAADEDDEERSLMLAWVVGDGHADPDARLVALFMSQVLLAGSGSPLIETMSTQGYGRPSPLSGAQVEEPDITFWVGMDGLTDAEVPQARAALATALAALAHDGLPREMLETALREMELGMRDLGDTFPTGVELLLDMAPLVLAGQDPSMSADLGRLDAWRGRLTDPTFVAQWVRERLVDNPRFVAVTQVPDPAAGERQDADLRAQLAEWNQRLSADQKAALAVANRALQDAQHAPPDADVLPCVDLACVDRDPIPALPHTLTLGSESRAMHLHVDAPLAGVVHAAVHFDLSGLEDDEAVWVRWAAALADEVGTAQWDWAEADRQRAALCQGFSTGVNAFMVQTRPEELAVRAFVQAKCLERDTSGLVEGLGTLRQASFRDTKRLRFLLQEHLKASRQGMAHLGGRWAALEAKAALHPASAWKHRGEGRGAVAFIEHLVQALKDAPDAVSARLSEAFDRLMVLPRAVVSLGSDVARQAGEALARDWAGPSFADPFQARGVSFQSQAGGAKVLVGATPVQFCHQAWTGPASLHADAPVLEVLAEGLEHGFLHRAIREEGSAYGSGASFQPGLFAMSSFRDPRLAGTFEDFDRAAAWAAGAPLGEQALREAKISAIRRLGAPMAPLRHAAGTAALVFNGTDDAQRRRYRAGVLDATAEDVQRVAATWLLGQPVSRCAFAGRTAAGQAAGWVQEPVWPTGRGVRKRRR